LAFTKAEKKELIARYEQWLKDSQAAYVLTYSGMNMNEVDKLRAEAREVGGEFHVVKNTLMKIALNNLGYKDKGFFEDSSLVAFAFQDAPSVAKVVEKANSTDIYTIKGGYLDGLPVQASEIISLAKLPPLPQVRAQLLALINTPATQLVRTISEPARQVAAVIKAYSEKNPVPAAG